MKKFYTLLIIFILGVGTISQAKEGLQIGDTIKNFTVYKYPDGTPLTRDSLKGKISVINFGATWCPICLDEKIVLENYLKNNPDILNKVNIIPIMLDSPRDIENYMNKHKFTFTAYEDKDNQTGNEFFIRGVPMSFIVNEEGVIVYKQIGEMSWDRLNTIHLKEE